jgi:hypothetical protein
MTAEEKNIRLIIKKTLSEMENVSESDILVRAGVNWDEVKPKFLEKVNNLVSKIDDDKYDDAEDLIGSVTAMLKMWRAKIKKGKSDMVNKVSNTETLDEELLEYFGGGDSFEHKIDTINIDALLNGLDTLRHYKPELYFKFFPNLFNKVSNTETLDEDFGSGLSVEEKYEILQKIKKGITGLIVGGFDKEKLKSMITTLIDNPKSI